MWCPERPYPTQRLVVWKVISDLLVVTPLWNKVAARTIVSFDFVQESGGLKIPAVEPAIFGDAHHHLGSGQRDGKERVLGVPVRFVRSARLES